MNKLTRERVCELFNYNSETGEIVHKFRAKETFSKNAHYVRHLAFVGMNAGWANSKGYIDVNVDGKKFKAHRVAWLIENGSLPEYPGFQIDHINGIRTDNRIENLRIVTSSENSKNSGLPVSNTSGVKGVYWHKQSGKWNAKIKIGKTLKCLGLFAEIEEAAKARKAAELENGYFHNSRKSHNLTEIMGAAQ